MKNSIKFKKVRFSDHASNAPHPTMRQMRPCVKCISCDNAPMRQMRPCDHASNATMSFQKSFRYGRVSLRIGDIADETTIQLKKGVWLTIEKRGVTDNWRNGCDRQLKKVLWQTTEKSSATKNWKNLSNSYSAQKVRKLHLSKFYRIFHDLYRSFCLLV